MSSSAARTGLEVAVVGMAARFPGAENIDAFWHNLCEGIESLRHFSEQELLDAGVPREVLTSPGFVPVCGHLADADLFDADFFGYTAREAEILDPQQRLFLETAWHALESSGHRPDQFAGPIGVYAGASANTYMLQIYSHPRLVADLGAFQLMLANDKDHLATRVSYKLDLTGPSVTVQTACSTSLVAVHLACQGLQAGECDLALAGGVAVRMPLKRGYAYREGGIGSPDGHCRPFDSKAQGTVAGDGVGAVVLKRLEDALADGDTIHAVIRATAINNDGGRKLGYTAPSIDGQRKVIRAALDLAEVEPETITYVEAHGTGTTLGDPIEVEALRQAFDVEPSPRHCALGSVKSNLGHLDAAAGVAGLIKTVLMLRHGRIPAALHYQSPNPKIDFDATPFHVNDRLREWTTDGAPRRASVSSFGIGGTNAHAVLEQAPPLPMSAPAALAAPAERAHHLLVLAAKDETALDEATGRLAQHLELSPELDLADVAYTLQIGRKAWPHRRMLVAASAAEAAGLLHRRDPQRLLGRRAVETERPVAFVFSGQGSQHPGMARELYLGEPTFRHWMDHCLDILEPEVGTDLRAELWPPPSRRDQAAERLQSTALAQPALFAVEYSLAQLWISWGLRPQAMLGHSLGEYVAACLAGVFSLRDALVLVAARGRLMQELEPGAMATVPLAAEEVEELLDDGLDLAAINGPRLCVVSGPRPRLEKWVDRLAAREISCRLLHTSHAFHSSMMEPVLEPFAAVLAGIPLKPPSEPFFSNLSGELIRAEEAMDPSYWVRHLRRPVRFADAVGRLLAEPHQILLEIGPGHALTTLARRHADFGGEHLALSSLPPANREEPDDEHLLTTLGRLWMAGAPIDWAAYHGERRRRRVTLPGYSFQRRRFWIEPSTAPVKLFAAAASSAASSAAELAEPGQAVAEAPSAGRSVGSGRSVAGHGRPTSLETAYVAPQSPVQERLVEIWQRLMGIEPIGIYDDFFELGGHSLLATEMMAQVRQTFRLDLTLRRFFQTPHIAGLAELIDIVRAETGEMALLPWIHPDLEKRHLSFPLTDIQQAYWIGRSEIMELGGVATHTYDEIDVRGVDLDRLAKALRRVIEYQPMLRAVIEEEGRQRILDEVPPYEIATRDFSEFEAREADQALAEIRAEMSHQVRGSEEWPLFELRASRLPEGRVRLHFSFDLLLGDALSFLLLSRDLVRFYGDPEAEVEPLKMSFRDYVLAEEALRSSEIFQRSQAYWRSRLDTLPPAPDLPLRPLPVGTRPRFVRRGAVLEPELWQALQQHGKPLGITAAGLLLSIFSQCLAQWSRRPAFTLNLTLFNRLPIHPQVNDVVGDFTSTLLLEVDLGNDAPFATQARRLQDQLWADLDHRYTSGVQVLRELSARRDGQVMMPVVFTSMLGLGQNADVWAPWRELGIEGEKVYGISQTPQVLLDHQAGERGGELYFNWDAVEDAFPPGMLDELFDAYCRLLRRLAEDARAWEARIDALLPEAALRHRRALNATTTAISQQTLHGLFREQAARDPEAVAVAAPDRRLTYGELDRWSDHLAHHLQIEGARTNQLVGVLLDKGWRQAVAVLAITKAGAAYLPIDPRQPKARRDYLLEHGGVEIALTDPTTAEELDWPDAVLRVEIDQPPTTVVAPTPAGHPDHLAYTIFTSGSTGEPKGVMIGHRGAVNTVLDLRRRLEVGPSDRVLALSALNFDLSVYDLFGLWAAGGRVVFPDAAARRDPGHWLTLIEREGVTLWNSTPGLMVMLMDWLEARPDPLPASLRLVLMSGDWIPVELPGRLRARSENVSILSLGGATEASIWSILFPVEEVDPSWPSIPYGHPMDNQTFHVLDHRFEPRPVWVPGELYIGGVGLAWGYWRDEEKTAAAFVRHPETGERLYRTGDWGRYLPDGEIEFLGREDSQVKIRGHRIELGEIETVLGRHPAVRAAVVQALGDPRGDRRLAAFVVPGDVDLDALRTFLEKSLPAYMVPERWCALDAFPLNANGKVDRSALRAPELSDGAVATDDGDRAPLEELIAQRWAEVLGIEAQRIGRRDDFFELGGQSLLATRLIAQLRKILDREIPLQWLFDHPTIAGLAKALQASRGRRIEVAAMTASARSAPGPVSFAQQRMWFLDRLEPGNPAFNLPVAVRIAGALDAERLAAALKALCRRHEILRAELSEADGKPLLRIVEPWSIDLERIDLSGLAEEARRARSEDLLRDAAAHRFRIEAAPLFRVALVRLADAEHVLLFTVHHLIFDGWSIEILTRDLGRIYDTLETGAAPDLPPLAVQYADYAAWQREHLDQGPRVEEQIDYWRRTLGDAPQVPPLPTDRPRAARPDHAGDRVEIEVSVELTEGLRRLGREQGVTLFMTLTAALHVLLQRFTGRPEIALATPVAGRAQAEVEHLIGCFLNTLVLKLDLADDPTCRELLARSRERVLGAWAHQDVPFERLVERLSVDRDPGAATATLYQALFVLQHRRKAPESVAGLEMRASVPVTETAIEDLALQFTEHDDRLTGVILYRRELFHAATIERMKANFLAVLEEMVEDPSRPISELRLQRGAPSRLADVFTQNLDDF